MRLTRYEVVAWDGEWDALEAKEGEWMKADEVRAVLDELRNGLSEIADDCKAVSEDQVITIGERRTWRVMQRKALRLFTRLQEVAP